MGVWVNPWYQQHDSQNSRVLYSPGLSAGPEFPILPRHCRRSKTIQTSFCWQTNTTCWNCCCSSPTSSCCSSTTSCCSSETSCCSSTTTTAVCVQPSTTV